MLPRSDIFLQVTKQPLHYSEDNQLHLFSLWHCQSSQFTMLFLLKEHKNIVFEEHKKFWKVLSHTAIVLVWQCVHDDYSRLERQRYMSRRKKWQRKQGSDTGYDKTRQRYRSWPRLQTEKIFPLESIRSLLKKSVEEQNQTYPISKFFTYSESAYSVDFVMETQK